MPDPVVPAPIVVPYAEKIESMRGGADDQGEWEQRVYYVAWENKSTFIAQMAGELSGGGSGPITVTKPYQCPSNPRLYAQNVAWAPAGIAIIGSDPAVYSDVEITVIFRVPTFGGIAYDPSLTLDPDEPLLEYCTAEIVYGRETLSRIGGSKWKSDAKAINSAFGVSITTIAVSLVYDEFPFMPWALLREYADAVNDDTFLGAAKGCIMFDGPKVSYKRTRAGKQALRLAMGMKYRSVSWNKSLRDDTSTWDTPVSSGYSSGSSDAYEKYAYKPFRKLLFEDFFS